jgi:thioredoxin
MPIVDLTRESFEQTVTGSNFVIVDFWAPWCGPCRGFAPVFKAAAEKHPDIVFGKVNTDEEQDIAAHFGIRSIPTLMIFRDQIVIFDQPGAMSASALDHVIGQAKGLDMDAVRKEIAEQETGQA